MLDSICNTWLLTSLTQLISLIVNQIIGEKSELQAILIEEASLNRSKGYRNHRQTISNCLQSNISKARTNWIQNFKNLGHSFFVMDFCTANFQIWILRIIVFFIQIWRFRTVRNSIIKESTLKPARTVSQTWRDYFHLHSWKLIFWFYARRSNANIF